jgi:hypothetical protein
MSTGLMPIERSLFQSLLQPLRNLHRHGGHGLRTLDKVIHGVITRGRRRPCLSRRATGNLELLSGHNRGSRSNGARNNDPLGVLVFVGL